MGVRVSQVRGRAGMEYTSLSMEHRAVLKPKEERRLLRGHMWAFRNEFAELPEIGDGAVVDVVTSHGRFVGRGFFQQEGGIAVRLLSRKAEPIDSAFLEHRVRRARAFRETLYPGASVYRWIYGESDELPGLVADRYGEVVSLHASAAFYAERLDTIAGAFLAYDDIEGVLANQQRYGHVPDVANCALGSLKLRVDMRQHQKTGLFLDQRENREFAARFCNGASVLDGHCYQGLWSCIAAQAGAAHVRGIDTSAAALERARIHAELNGVDDRCTFEEADIMNALAASDRYDVVILDPPALAKSRSAQPKALGMYRNLNKAGIECVKPGGYLITSSCSHFVSRDDFLETLKRAATAAQRHCACIAMSGAAPDHPVLLAMPETAYLTCAVLRVF